MSWKPWLAALTVAAVSCGPAAQAGLFDRLRERAEERAEEKAERAEREAAVRELAERGVSGRGAVAVNPVSFAVADQKDIGKFIHPVSYQPLPAPAPLEGPLHPVPDPYPSGPAPARSFYPAAPGEPLPLGSVPAPLYPGEAFPPSGPIYPVEGFPLYHRVKYEDLDNIHPCAVTTVVQVLDPCENPCNSCGPRCVYVKICVPPNECPKIRVSDGGREIKYKFDEYSVEIESEDGIVSVNYDD